MGDGISGVLVEYNQKNLEISLKEILLEICTNNYYERPNSPLERGEYSTV